MSKIKSYLWDKIQESDGFYLDSKESTKVIPKKGTVTPLEGPTRHVNFIGKGLVASGRTCCCIGFKSVK